MLTIGFDVGGTNVRGVGLRPGSTEPLAIRRSKTRPNGDVLVFWPGSVVGAIWPPVMP